MVTERTGRQYPHVGFGLILLALLIQNLDGSLIGVKDLLLVQGSFEFIQQGHEPFMGRLHDPA